MSVSLKNTNTLVKIFLKHPNEFENYVKGCLNTIDKINFLKESQFDESIDNYHYFKCLSGAIPFDISLGVLNIEYRKKLSEQIPKERIINVKTNVFYIDSIGDFIDEMNNHSEENNHHYSRMICSILINPELLCDEKSTTSTSITDFYHNHKVYTISELINLSKENMISIIDNYIEADNISDEELRNGLIDGTFVLQEANLNWIGFDNKVHADFISCKNEYDRMVWQILYVNFLRYIRTDKIYCYNSFDDNHNNGYNLSYYFYKTIEHLEEIFSKIKSSYRKKKKKLPNNYEKIMQDALYKMDIEKSKFQKNENREINLKQKK